MTFKSTPNELSIPAALIRLYWFFIGNAILFILAIIIGSQSIKSIFLPSAIYWAVVTSLIGTRYIDIRFFNDHTTEDQSMTLYNWLRYSVLIFIFFSVVWGVAILIAHFTGK
jgi:hypothetical protein